ncbi:dapper homolog 2 [Conger conger]|uniref:dapper homolog 2 n=1 Tax=Conger conger TaxID=82655 RepID=UPI002A59A42B|nr:dapper homolog 2 [Conger conger]
MMSKKISGSGLLNAAAGIDRGRVGERLRAALAGLEELHFLKEKQRNMVFWALRMDREETLSSNDPSAESPEVETEEQRLEATLTALKQQLSRLRRQDVGLKTHLQELDQQISELKLDACKVSSEHLEADSRPSSGFYDLSDGGSGSLSNSCTSVYSECLSSSQTSLLLCAPCLPGPGPGPGPYPPRAPGPPEASRRRSADESSAQGEGVRTGGVRLGSAWIRAGASGADRARQRPVSTGDLERMMNGTRTSPGHSQRGPTVDPKYHSNLVSRSGAEVYRYPSPLHAVALQSPIFSLSVDGAPAAAQTPGGAPGAGESPQTTGDGSENRPGVYINKLLQRSVSRTSLLGDGGRDRAQPPARTHTEVPAAITGVPGLTGGPALRPQDPSLHQRQVEMGRELPPESGRTPAAFRCGQDPVNRVGPASVPNHPQEGPCPCRCYPAAPSEPKPRDAVLTSDPSGCVQAEERKSSRADLSSREQPRGAALTRKPSDKRPRIARSASKEEGRGQDRPPAGGAQPEFVHAQFVPAGAQRVRVKQADRKTKAVRLRKRSSEKPRPSTQHLAHVEVGRDPGDRGPRHPGPARASRKLAHSRGEGSGRSCSETSLCGPAFPRHHPSQPDPALRSGKAHRPHAQEVSLAELARRKQVTRKWSVAEVACQRAQEVSTQAAMRRSGAVPRSVSVRPTSGQWVGHPYPASSSSYLAGFGSRYPAAPFPAGRSRRPPPSESEYSADCASLFHSTIAESSEGELSDFTANRFGDSESSDSRSDSDSSLSPGEEEEEEEEEGGGEEGGGLVWAEAALGPTAAGVTLHPSRSEPPACRIKASRALKKKIRHFEPAALKVMTLV